MRALRSLSLVPCALLITAGPALCQTSSSAPEPGAYMTGAAGTSFGGAQAATFGIEIGETINRRVQAYTAFTYFENLLNDAAHDDLARLGVQLTNATGTVWEFEGRDRGLAFGGGAKYLFSQSGSVRPYVGGGPGVLNVRRVISERDLGDLSDEVLAVFGAPDGVIDTAKVSTFKPMAEILAGVGIAAGRTYVDVGYRFRKVFHSREKFDFSQFTVGVGMRF